MAITIVVDLLSQILVDRAVLDKNVHSDARLYIDNVGLQRVIVIPVAFLFNRKDISEVF